MKISLRLEEFFMLLLGAYLFSGLDYSWWWFLILFLTPDVGMLGYMVNEKIGAVTYNLFHHKGIAIVAYLSGVYFQNDLLKLVGTILFAHSSFDRVFGYGLKFYSNFKDTHLGQIGK